jgi:hypothetical protein
VCRIGKPARAVGNEGPGTDLRDPLRQRVDLALGRIGPAHLLGHVAFVDMTAAHNITIDGADQIGVLGRRDPAIVRQRAHIPQGRDPLARRGQVADGGIADHRLQRLLVDRRRRPGQPFDRRRGLDRPAQRVETGKLELGGAPLQHPDRLEIVRLDLFDEVVVERIDLAGDPERTVAHVTAGAAGDLAKLRGGELAVLVAVEFAVLREGDMVDIEIEPHADCIGGDQIVNITRLVERDLGVARARAERAEHHRRAAALATDQLGDRVDLVGGKGNDCRARRQPRDLLGARIGKMRHARPGYHRQALEQLFQNAAHCGRAEQKRFLPAAQMQDTVGEDMAALQIAGELHLVDRHKGGVGLARHRLHCTDRETRAGRLDLLLAGNQRDIVGADPLGDTPIDLARQKPQWQADHTCFVRDHPFDGEMGLAGIGRSENRGHVAPGHNQRTMLFRLDIHEMAIRPFAPMPFCRRPIVPAPCTVGEVRADFATKT